MTTPSNGRASNGGSGVPAFRLQPSFKDIRSVSP